MKTKLWMNANTNTNTNTTVISIAFSTVCRMGHYRSQLTRVSQP